MQFSKIITVYNPMKKTSNKDKVSFKSRPLQDRSFITRNQVVMYHEASIKEAETIRHLRFMYARCLFADMLLLAFCLFPIPPFFMLLNAIVVAHSFVKITLQPRDVYYSVESNPVIDEVENPRYVNLIVSAKIQNERDNNKQLTELSDHFKHLCRTVLISLGSLIALYLLYSLKLFIALWR